MGLADNLKIRRKELGLTLAEVAKRVGVTEATVQRWESGNIKNLRQERICALAEALRTTPAYLMGWTSPGDELIGQRIGEAMEQEGISVEELSLRTNISVAELRRYLAGEDLAQISLPRLGKLADALHTTVAFLTSTGIAFSASGQIEGNIIKLKGDDGTVTTRKLSAGQYDLFKKMLEQLPEKGGD